MLFIGIPSERIFYQLVGWLNVWWNVWSFGSSHPVQFFKSATHSQEKLRIKMEREKKQQQKTTLTRLRVQIDAV